MKTAASTVVSNIAQVEAEEHGHERLFKFLDGVLAVVFILAGLVTYLVAPLALMYLVIQSNHLIEATTWDTRLIMAQLCFQVGMVVGIWAIAAIVNSCAPRKY